MEDKDRLFKQLTEEATLLARASVIRTSAVRGQGVAKIPELLLELRTRWASRATTSRVNQVLQEQANAAARAGAPPGSMTVAELSDLTDRAAAGTMG